VAARTKRGPAGRSLGGVAGSNPAWNMVVYLVCVCIVCLSGRGVCDGLITHAGASYPVWCVIVKPLK
jgi:hypothetical protein